MRLFSTYVFILGGRHRSECVSLHVDEYSTNVLERSAQALKEMDSRGRGDPSRQDGLERVVGTPGDICHRLFGHEQGESGRWHHAGQHTDRQNGPPGGDVMQRVGDKGERSGARMREWDQHHPFEVDSSRSWVPSELTTLRTAR